MLRYSLFVAVHGQCCSNTSTEQMNKKQLPGPDSKDDTPASVFHKNMWILYNFNFKLIRLSCRWVKNLQLHTDTVSCFHDCSHLPWDETCPIRHSHPARFKHISVWLPLSSFHSTVAHPQRAWKTASFLFLQLVIHAKTSSAKAAIYCLRWGR